jgi:hypothetical protein
MNFLLDTNIRIYLVKKKTPQVLQKFPSFCSRKPTFRQPSPLTKEGYL